VVGWPSANLAQDSRSYLNFWGSDTAADLGGCCAVRYNDTSLAWGQPLHMLIRPFPEHGACAATNPILLDDVSIVSMGSTQAPSAAPTPAPTAAPTA
jgi:hypothetical protein